MGKELPIRLDLVRSAVGKIHKEIEKQKKRGGFK